MSNYGIKVVGVQADDGRLHTQGEHDNYTKTKPDEGRALDVEAQFRDETVVLELGRYRICRRRYLPIFLTLKQWFLTWGPGTPWGSQTPILGVPNANLEYQQISPNIFASHSIRVAFVYTLRTLSYLASHSSSVFSSFLFSLVIFFSFHASVPRIFRSAYFFNFDLGVPDDIGRVQGIPAVKKVKNHCSKILPISTFLLQRSLGYSHLEKLKKCPTGFLLSTLVPPIVSTIHGIHTVALSVSATGKFGIFILRST